MASCSILPRRNQPVWFQSRACSTTLVVLRMQAGCAFLRGSGEVGHVGVQCPAISAMVPTTALSLEHAYPTPAASSQVQLGPLSSNCLGMIRTELRRKALNNVCPQLHRLVSLPHVLQQLSKGRLSLQS